MKKKILVLTISLILISSFPLMAFDSAIGVGDFGNNYVEDTENSDRFYSENSFDWENESPFGYNEERDKNRIENENLGFNSDDGPSSFGTNGPAFRTTLSEIYKSGRNPGENPPHNGPVSYGSHGPTNSSFLGSMSENPGVSWKPENSSMSIGYAPEHPPKEYGNGYLGSYAPDSTEYKGSSSWGRSHNKNPGISNTDFEDGFGNSDNTPFHTDGMNYEESSNNFSESFFGW